MAAAYLHEAFGPGWRGLDLGITESRWKIFEQLFAKPALRTSSCGRLFDAVSAMAGVCRQSSYEGEAAMLLEAACAPGEDGEYPFTLAAGEVDTRPLVCAVASDARAGAGAGTIAARFHNTMARIIERVCAGAAEETGIRKVCLSGGTFQNTTLVARVMPLLEARGFEVYTQRQVPANDGGLSLGQAAVAAYSSTL
jgi:hydrogenase maturation protein HypF